MYWLLNLVKCKPYDDEILKSERIYISEMQAWYFILLDLFSVLSYILSKIVGGCAWMLCIQFWEIYENFSRVLLIA